MAYFKWFGYDMHHAPRMGYVACQSTQHVTALLKEQNIECVHVNEIRHHLLRPCNFGDRQVVLQELSQLLEAQVRLSQALEIISSLVKKEYIRQVLLDCMRSVQQGKSFADVAERYPELFDPLTLHAFKSGHDSGLLARVCSARSKQLEHIAQLRSKVAAVVAMPLITLIFFATIFTFLMAVILPQFKKIFTMLRSPVPASTQFLLRISDYMTVSTLMAVLGLCAATIVLCVALGKTAAGRTLYDRFLLYFPGVNAIYQDLARAQCLQSLSLLISSGRTLADALGRVAQSFNNRILREQLMQVMQQVQAGKPFTDAIDLCPTLAIPEIKNCLAIAHETAELEVILQQLSIIARKRALKKLDRLTLLIQPILLICLGAAIGGVLLALYLPLLQIPNML